MKKAVLILAALGALAMTTLAGEAQGDRWLLLSRTPNGAEYYVDNQTWEYGRLNNGGAWASTWTKWVYPDGRYSLDHIQLQKGWERILGSVRYSPQGAIEGQDQTTSWFAIVPESTGEALYKLLLVTIPEYTRQHPPTTPSSQYREPQLRYQ